MATSVNSKERHKAVHHLSARSDGHGWVESIARLTDENAATTLLQQPTADDNAEVRACSKHVMQACRACTGICFPAHLLFCPRIAAKIFPDQI